MIDVTTATDDELALLAVALDGIQMYGRWGRLGQQAVRDQTRLRDEILAEILRRRSVSGRPDTDSVS